MTEPSKRSQPLATVLREGDERPGEETLARVRAALEAGELVGLPTETVYGLAARADSAAALERLRAAKGRDPDLAFTWHVAERDAVERFTDLLPLARRLTERYWPGPLTLVLSGAPAGLERVARDGWTGLRQPSHAATWAVLRAVEFPVVLSSANRSGGSPCTTADAVAELFGDAVALVVDGGRSRLGEASGVLRLGPGRFELLREGLLPVEDLRRTAGLRIGFVCTGNTFRSPMAEALAGRILRRRLGLDGAPADRGGLELFGFELVSMGVAAGAGAPASRLSLEVMAARGLSLDRHRSRAAVPEHVRSLDLVYALTTSHLESIRASLPPGAEVGLQLLDPAGHDVPDPIGGTRADYERCATEIEKALEVRARDWA